MFNNIQTQEPIVDSHDSVSGHLDVFDIWETIQGEGPYTGQPCVFVRLAGCNLQCTMCDTDYTSQRKWLKISLVVERISAIRQSGLVVLTGGEPLRQPIGPLVDALVNSDFYVQIETNGIFFRPEVRYANMKTVVSPKTRQINDRYLTGVYFPICYKYVIEADHVDPDDGLPTSVLGKAIRPARPPEACDRKNIYISPADDGKSDDPASPYCSEYLNQNINAAVESCLKYGYTLSLQTHKIIGVK